MKFGKIYRVICSVLCLIILLPVFTACSVQKSDWAVYIYMCGSSLESEYGCGTNNLVEMISANLPKGATVIIETGGSSEWKTEAIDPNSLQRWTIKDGNLQNISTNEISNMGDSNTLYDFVDFCREKYPAEKEALIFWNHGGGCLSGACFDENYESDALRLNEISSALQMSADKYQNPFEFIGFDACLMANFETASILKPYANYLVASEETEPMGGWNYKSLLESLTAENDGIAVGTQICDSYMEKCRESNKESNSTLSVVDLSKIGEIEKNFNSLTATMTENITNLTEFAETVRRADSSQKFGGTNENEGYSNLIDMLDFSEKLSDESTVTSELSKSIENAVVYNVAGDAKKDAAGLSLYYPIHIKEKQLNRYFDICPIESYKNYIEKIYATIPESTIEFTDYGSKSADGGLSVTVKNPEFILKADMSVIAFNILGDSEYVSEGIGLGFSDQLTIDADSGTITGKFDGVWPTLNYYPLNISKTEYGKNIFSSPILLNGEQTNLRYMRAEDGSYSIIGTWKGINLVSGVADKDIYQLKNGDEITPLYKIHYTGDMSSDFIEGEKIIYDENVKITDEDLQSNYIYQYVIILTDIYGRQYYSDSAVMSIVDGTPVISAIDHSDNSAYD